ncbi:MAG TPA: DUF6677 family protein [Planctomycetota bacterium]|nr:DUF6677 family protein [Planctomycetota bacterium]
MNSRLEWKVVLGAVIVLTVIIAALAKEGERRRAAAFLLAWMLPGAGHVFLGRWKKGLSLLALMGATYLFGAWIVGFRAVSFDDNPFYYVGQYGSGATFLLAQILGVEKAYPRQENPGWFDPGLLYVCVVGLLNLVLMINTLDLKLAPAPAAVPAATVAAPAPGAAPNPAPPSGPPPAPGTTA